MVSSLRSSGSRQGSPTRSSGSVGSTSRYEPRSQRRRSGSTPSLTSPAWARPRGSARPHRPPLTPPSSRRRSGLRRLQHRHQRWRLRPAGTVARRRGGTSQAASRRAPSSRRTAGPCSWAGSGIGLALFGHWLMVFSPTVSAGIRGFSPRLSCVGAAALEGVESSPVTQLHAQRHRCLSAETDVSRFTPGDGREARAMAQVQRCPLKGATLSVDRTV